MGVLAEVDRDVALPAAAAPKPDQRVGDGPAGKLGPVLQHQAQGMGRRLPAGAPDMQPPSANARQRACQGHGTVEWWGRHNENIT